MAKETFCFTYRSIVLMKLWINKGWKRDNPDAEYNKIVQ